MNHFVTRYQDNYNTIGCLWFHYCSLRWAATVVAKCHHVCGYSFLFSLYPQREWNLAAENKIPAHSVQNTSYMHSLGLAYKICDVMRFTLQCLKLKEPTAVTVKCTLKQPRFHAWHHQKLHIKTGQLPLTITDCLKWSHSWTATCFLLFSQTAFSCENLPGLCNSHSFTFKWAHQMSLISL